MVQGNQTDLGVSRGRFRTMLSRRGVMGAAIASAVVGLSQMSNAKVAEAADNGAMILGANATTNVTTQIIKTGGNTTGAFYVQNNNANAIDCFSSTNYGLNAGGVNGIIGATLTAGGVGVYGSNLNQTTGQGVLGSCPSTIGVWGASSTSIGVQGSSAGSHAIFGSASAASVSGVLGTNPNSAGAGVTGSSSGAGIGVSASSASGAGLFAVSGSSTAVIGRSTTGKAGEFFGDVEITGNFTASGMKSAAVKVGDGSIRRMYCLESPLSFFEDMGTGQVANGRASVTLDPMFLSTVSTEDYQVYLTPEGDCRGLYVESKSTGGFAVSELMGGTSTVKFSWRVVAKRTGIPNERFAPVSMSLDPNGGPKMAPQKEVEIPQMPTAPKTNLNPR